MAVLAAIAVFGVLYWIVESSWLIAFAAGVAVMLGGTLLARRMSP